MHAAVREVAHRHRDPDRVDEVAGVLKSFALRTELWTADRKGMRWTPPVDVPAPPGVAPTPATSSSTWSSCSPTSRTWPATSGSGIALFVDEMQDIATPELAALCGACHEISQQGAPLIVVGAGLPHLPVALAASKSYAERLFRYASVDRLPREMADRAWRLPGGRGGRRLRGRRRSTSSTGSPTATPTSCRPTARSPGTPRSSPDHGAATSTRPPPEAEAELAVGFFGARYDRATPAERDYMTAMADLGADRGDGAVDGAIATADVARHLARKAQSLSPARDGLIKKGLVYSAERGSVAFTVPHFGKFLRSR